MAHDESQLVAWIQDEISQAEGFDGDELKSLRRDALDRYYGRARGNEVLGRSDAQDNSIADMLEAIVSQILPSFSIDSVCEFEPISDEDVEAAQLESDVVNDVIIEQNRGYVFLQESLRDALLLRNGWTKVFLDERTDVQSERFRGIEEIAIVALLEQGDQDPELELEPINLVENDDGTIDVTIKATRNNSTFKCVSVDPTLMLWQRDHDSIFLKDVRFLAERWFPSQTELLQRGFDKTKVMDARTFTLDSEEDSRARYRSTNTGLEVPEPSMRHIEAFWVHYRYDSDDDGIAELHRILYLPDNDPGKGAILEDVQVSFVPYATGTPFLQPHQLNGLGLADKLTEIEDDKTEALRQWLDNLKANNNARLAVNSQTVDVEDAVESRPGGIVRVNGPVNGNVVQIPVNDVGSSALQALEYLDKIRSERAGASLDLGSAQLQIAGETAHGIERQISSREQLAAMMTATLAETMIRETYLLTHRGLREWMDKPVKARIRGKFVEADPSQWIERDRVNVKSGLSVGERSAKRGALAEVLAQQEKLAAAGLDDVLVNAQNHHSAIIDWTRAAMIDNGHRYFLDPESEESLDAVNRKAATAEQERTQSLQIAQEAASAERNAQTIESMISKYKVDLDTAFKYWSESLKAETAEGEQKEELQSVGEIRSDESQRRGAITNQG